MTRTTTLFACVLLACSAVFAAEKSSSVKSAPWSLSFVLVLPIAPLGS